MKLLLVFCVLLLVGCLEANGCIPIGNNRAEFFDIKPQNEPRYAHHLLVKMKLLLVFSVLLLAGCLSAERCIPKRCPRNEIWSCCPACPQKYCTPVDIKCTTVCRPACVCRPGYVREARFGNCIPEKQCNSVTKAPPPASSKHLVFEPAMNWAIVLLVAAGCSMCNAQTKAIQRPVASRPSTLVQQGLIPLVGGAKCPI
uniref:TIL domain-containing protein n=1 Tax=Anopheles minimus TaxID=112268 RepID=A0A182VXB2_9DIPT